MSKLAVVKPEPPQTRLSLAARVPPLLLHASAPAERQPGKGHAAAGAQQHGNGDAGVQPAPASRCHGRRDQSTGVELAVAPAGTEAPALMGWSEPLLQLKRGRIRDVVASTDPRRVRRRR